MGTIIPFLPDGPFDPKHVTAMPLTLNDICGLLKLGDDSVVREVIATRIIDLVRPAPAPRLLTSCVVPRLRWAAVRSRSGAPRARRL